MEQVPTRTVCYDYNNLAMSLENEKEKAVQKIMGLHPDDAELLFGGIQRDVSKALEGESLESFQKRKAEFRYAEAKGYLVKKCGGETRKGVGLETVYGTSTRADDPSGGFSADISGGGGGGLTTGSVDGLVVVEATPAPPPPAGPEMSARIASLDSGTYGCEVEYKSTGNNVVDGVLQRLHWTDAQYSLSDEESARALLLKTIVGPIYDFTKSCADWISDKCLPSDTRISRKHHFYPTETGPDVKDCFKISKPR